MITAWRTVSQTLKCPFSSTPWCTSTLNSKTSPNVNSTLSATARVVRMRGKSRTRPPTRWSWRVSLSTSVKWRSSSWSYRDKRASSSSFSGGRLRGRMRAGRLPRRSRYARSTRVRGGGSSRRPWWKGISRVRWRSHRRPRRFILGCNY